VNSVKTSRDYFNEIRILIQARYPIIYIISSEENRVEKTLSQIAQRLNKKLFLWSFTKGLYVDDEPYESQKAQAEKFKDPMSALNRVVAEERPSIFVFKDLHNFLTRTNIAIVRLIREIAQEIKNTYNSFIIISPILVTVPDIEKEITIVDYQLPTVKELDELLTRIISEVRKNPSIKVEIRDDTKEKMLKAAQGLTLTEAENVFAKTIVRTGTLTGDDISSIFSEKKQIIRKLSSLEYYETDENLDTIGGLEGLKDWLLKRKLAFTEKAREFGLPTPKGILLIGIQGCGKSLCAKAVAKLWELPLLRLDIGSVFGSLVGSSEETIRNTIKTAESIAPVILWVDEIDKAFTVESISGGGDSGTSMRVFGTFLTWMSEKNSPVFIVATANKIAELPPELMRKGRFDEIFFVDLPKYPERCEIFRIHIAKRQRKPEDFDIDLLAKESEGFSGAEIEQAIISALYNAFYEQREVDTQMILVELKSAVPLSVTMAEQLNMFREIVKGRARNASKAQISASKKSISQEGKQKGI